MLEFEESDATIFTTVTDDSVIKIELTAQPLLGKTEGVLVLETVLEFDYYKVGDVADNKTKNMLLRMLAQELREILVEINHSDVKPG